MGVVHSLLLRVGRETIGLVTVLADVDHVQTAHFGFTVDLSLAEALSLQDFNAGLRLRDHFIAVAEAERFRLAGLHAGRDTALLKTVHAGRALVDLVIARTEARHVERAGRTAVLAAVALLGVEVHDAVLVVEQRVARAHLDAGSVRAVHAGAAADSPVDRLELVAGLFLVEGLDKTRIAIQIHRALEGAREFRDVVTERSGKFVPLLARHLAALAASAKARVKVDGDIIRFCHYLSPSLSDQAFSTLTRKPRYSGIWEFGSPTFGVRSFIVQRSLA